MIGIALSAALLVLLVLLLLRDIRQNRAAVIFILRCLMIVLTALLLSGFIFRKTLKQRPKIDLLVLVDESQSMSAGKKSIEEGDALSRLPRKPGWHVEEYGFDDTIRPISSAQQLTAQGKRTDISQALSFARTVMPGAGVLLSDGEHNASRDPAQIAQKLGFPVYTIGIGRKARRDLEVERIILPGRVVLGDTVRVGVRLRGRGFSDDRTQVHLFEDGKLVETRDIVLGRDESQQEVEFRAVPGSPGRHSYLAIADSMFGEDNYANNRRQTGLEVLPSRTRVMYLTNEPGFSTRILMNLLRANRDIELVSVIAMTGGTLQRMTDKGTAPYSLGSSVEADVVIADNLDETALGAQTSDVLLSFAASHGLLVLGGERFHAGKALTSLLPLAPTGDRIAKELQLELTEDGRGTPVLFDGAQNLLAGAPPFWGAVRSTGVRSDAKVWAKASDGTPLIAFRRNGSGKVLEIAGYPLWRFGFAADAGDALARFLNNAVRFLALKDVEAFRLTSDKPEYYSGEPVSFLLQAVSEDGRPWKGLDARLLIPDTRISQPMTEKGDGLYEAVVEALSPGTHTARVEVFSQERPLGNAEHEVSVSELSLELAQTGLNDDLLRRIAAASGGAYVPYDSLGTKPFDIRLAEYRRLITFDPRLNRYLFLLIAALFVAEIFLRKRRGMQ